MISLQAFDDHNICWTRQVATDLWECLTDTPYLCPHSFSFGLGRFCKHPKCREFEHRDYASTLAPEDPR